jgi:peptide deformylase
MTILSLVIAPDPRLKTKSATVDVFDDELHQLARDLFDTMYFEKGIGLAAVQVGVLKRLLVADVEWKDDGTTGTQYVLVNPEIIEESPMPKVYKEGCLSFPDQFAEVTRPDSIRVRFQDLDGKTQEQQFTGLLATCIQHEIDHTNGITFVDHISRLKREMIHKKLTKMKKMGVFDHEHHEGCGHDHSHDHAHHHHDHVHGEHCNH